MVPNIVYQPHDWSEAEKRHYYGLSTKQELLFAAYALDPVHDEKRLFPIEATFQPAPRLDGVVIKNLKTGGDNPCIDLIVCHQINHATEDWEVILGHKADILSTLYPPHYGNKNPAQGDVHFPLGALMAPERNISLAGFTESSPNALYQRIISLCEHSSRVRDYTMDELVEMTLTGTVPPRPPHMMQRSTLFPTAKGHEPGQLSQYNRPGVIYHRMNAIQEQRRQQAKPSNVFAARQALLSANNWRGGVNANIDLGTIAQRSFSNALAQARPLPGSPIAGKTETSTETSQPGLNPLQAIGGSPDVFRGVPGRSHDYVHTANQQTLRQPLQSQYYLPQSDEQLRQQYVQYLQPRQHQQSTQVPSYQQRVYLEYEARRQAQAKAQMQRQTQPYSAATSQMHAAMLEKEQNLAIARHPVPESPTRHPMRYGQMSRPQTIRPAAAGSTYSMLPPSLQPQRQYRWQPRDQLQPHPVQGHVKPASLSVVQHEPRSNFASPQQGGPISKMLEDLNESRLERQRQCEDQLDRHRASFPSTPQHHPPKVRSSTQQSLETIQNPLPKESATKAGTPASEADTELDPMKSPSSSELSSVKSPSEPSDNEADLDYGSRAKSGIKKRKISAHSLKKKSQTVFPKLENSDMSEEATEQTSNARARKASSKKQQTLLASARVTRASSKRHNEEGK